jgi:hypothetical protein
MPEIRKRRKRRKPRNALDRRALRRQLVRSLPYLLAAIAIAAWLILSSNH